MVRSLPRFGRGRQFSGGRRGAKRCHTPFEDTTRFHIIFAYYSLMDGERASTTRMRLAGKICCACKVSLPPEPNQKPGERCCARCAPHHRVLMQFMVAK